MVVRRGCCLCLTSSCSAFAPVRFCRDEPKPLVDQWKWFPPLLPWHRFSKGELEAISLDFAALSKASGLLTKCVPDRDGIKNFSLRIVIDGIARKGAVAAAVLLPLC